MATPKEADLSDWAGFLSDLKNMTLSEFLETYCRGEKDLAYWVNQLIVWEAQQSESAQAKEALRKWLSSYQEMEIFHQPPATKWTLFISFLREHVLPRLSR
jgi:hypothetical protein